MANENLKINTPLPVVYLFDDGEVRVAPYLHLGYKKYVYGAKFAPGLLLSRLYAPDSDWDTADALAKKFNERLMKEVELLQYWEAKHQINATMQILRQYGIAADNVKNGYHWGWADWKGPWKDSMCCGHLTPRYHDNAHDHVRMVLNKF